MSETTCQNCERIGRTCPACIAERIKPTTPPTPDLDAVREALVRVLVMRTHGSIGGLADVLGVDFGVAEEWRSTAGRIADALLAAVARPAEARGEPVAWVPKLGDGRLLLEHAEPTRECAMESVNIYNAMDPAEVAEGIQPMTAIPLYTHPAPSGGDGEANLAARLSEPDDDWEDVKQRLGLAAPRPEPGEPSEAMVEAGLVAFDAGIPWRDEREQVREILRAALAAQRGTK